MGNVIKLRKGLSINLKGRAKKETVKLGQSAEYTINPSDFVGVVPKVIVHEGEHVKAGETLFVNKNCPEVKFSSPVSGIVNAVERGERRKVLGIHIQADAVQEFIDFGIKDIASLKKEEIVSSLLDAGLFGFINQLPYAVSTTPTKDPKGIFVSTLRDMPLANDFSYELEGCEDDFQTGLTALSKISPLYLNIGKEQQKNKSLALAKDVTITVFDGPCPAGNVGVHVNHISPVNKGEVVWTVDPSAVIFFGRLFNTGMVKMKKRIAVAGSGITNPSYVETLIGTPLGAILEGNLVRTDHIRVINGNPLTGKKDSLAGFLGAHTSEITVIPEGDNVNEILGWMLPRLNQYSAYRSYFSWLQGKNKEYDLDARIKGGERHMIMGGEYNKVLPMDIYGEQLIKAIIAGDIDKQEQLGIYEVSPEDFAVAEFVDSSKLELQRIVRHGLDVLRKENA